MAIKDFRLTISSVAELISEFTELVKADHGANYRLTLERWDARGLSANGQQHVWYSMLNDHFGYQQDKHVNPAKDMCKVMFGVPIILGNPHYGPLISANFDSVGFWDKSFEEQCNIIRIIAITSLFSSKESKQYMDQIVFYFADKEVEIKYKD